MSTVPSDRNSHNFQFKVVLGVCALDSQQNCVRLHCHEAQRDVIGLGVRLIASWELVLHDAPAGAELVCNGL